MSGIKLISLWEPWATLMAIGAKRIETRSWRTPYRGWLAIQAGATAKLGRHKFDADMELSMRCESAEQCPLRAKDVIGLP